MRENRNMDANSSNKNISLCEPSPAEDVLLEYRKLQGQKYQRRAAEEAQAKQKFMEEKDRQFAQKLQEEEDGQTRGLTFHDLEYCQSLQHHILQSNQNDRSTTDDTIRSPLRTGYVERLIPDEGYDSNPYYSGMRFGRRPQNGPRIDQSGDTRNSGRFIRWIRTGCHFSSQYPLVVLLALLTSLLLLLAFVSILKAPTTNSNSSYDFDGDNNFA